MKHVMVPKKADENLVQELNTLAQELERSPELDGADPNYASWLEGNLNPTAMVTEFLNGLNLQGQAAETAARLDGMIQLGRRYLNLLNLQNKEQYDPEKFANYANSLLGRDRTVSLRQALKDFLEATGDKYADTPEIKEIYTMISRVDKASARLEKLAVREISADNAEMNETLDGITLRIRKYNSDVEEFVKQAEENRINTDDPEFIDKMIDQADKKMDELKSGLIAAQLKTNRDMKGYEGLREKLLHQDKTLESNKRECERADAAREEALAKKQELLVEMNALKLREAERPEQLKKLIAEYHQGVKERHETIRAIESQFTAAQISKSEDLHYAANLAQSCAKAFLEPEDLVKPPKLSVNDAKLMKSIVAGEISPSQADFDGPRMNVWLNMIETYRQLSEYDTSRRDDTVDEELADMFDTYARELDVYEYSDLKWKYRAPDIRDTMGEKFKGLSATLDYSVMSMGKDLMHRFYEQEDLEEFKKEMEDKVNALSEDIRLSPEKSMENKLTEKLMQADEKVKFAAAHAENAKAAMKKSEAEVTRTRAEMQEILDGAQKSKDEANAITAEMRKYDASKAALNDMKARKAELENTRTAITADIREFNTKLGERKITDGRTENINDDLKKFMASLNDKAEGHKNSPEFSEMAEALESLRATLQGAAENFYTKEDIADELTNISQKAEAYRRAKAGEHFVIEKWTSPLRTARLNFARDIKTWADSMQDSYREQISIELDASKKALISKLPEGTLLPEQKASALKAARNLLQAEPEHQKSLKTEVPVKDAPIRQAH